MSQIQPIIVRDPRSFKNNRNSVINIAPSELKVDNQCGVRNSNSSLYRNYAPYESDSTNFSSLINIPKTLCKEPTVIDGQLYKHSQDITGNQFLLFKTIANENTITDKKEALGKLYVLDIDNNPLETLGNLTLADLEVKDVQVFYDKIIIVEDDKIWLGNSRDLQFFALGYMTHFLSCVDDKQNPVFILDEIANGFSLLTYDGKRVNNLSPSKRKLILHITSGVLNFKNDHIQLMSIDTSGPFFDQFSFLQIDEYEISEDEWNTTFFDNFPYEILGGYSKNGQWFVFHEHVTYPNFVGGTCFSIKEDGSTPTLETPCPKKPDLFLEY